MKQRLEAAFDEFVDVDDVDDRTVAEMVADLQTDIAVDLMGYTAGATD
jgi:predicted O-linked N-acetylglucosamine transferase (SPINDLY family)